jgi:hypothetical protein
MWVSRLGIIVASIASLITVTVVTYMVPTNVDFDPYNTGWNGLSELARSFGAAAIDNLEEVRPQGILMVVGPSKHFSSDEIRILRSFLEGGGILILMDDFGTGNEVLEGLGLRARINGSIILDPLLRYKDRHLPIAFIEGIRGLEGRTIVLNYASAIQDLDPGAGILLTSSPYSCLDLDGDGSCSDRDPRGSFVVAAEIPLGGGRVVIVSDPSIAINSMIGLEDNRAFMESLIGSGTPVYIDRSHLGDTVFSLIKLALYRVFAVLSSAEARYSIAIVLAMIIARVRVSTTSSDRTAVEAVIRRHPTWDKRVLTKLAEELGIGQG